MGRRKFTPDEESLLKELSEYKWEEPFKCWRCGRVNELIKSEYPYGKRCKCKTDESVLAHTVFDSGSSFEQSYYIIHYLYENSRRNWDQRALMRDQFDSISPNDFATAFEKGEISRTNFDRQLIEWANETKISVTRTARHFEVEENTIRLLFEKIDFRLDNGGSDNLNIRVMDFFASHDWDYILGLLMFPMRKDENWKRGILTNAGKTFYVRPQPFQRETEERKGLAWRLVEITK